MYYANSGRSRILEGGRRICPTDAHLNDLVSGRLFTEPGRTRELAEKLLFTAVLIGS